MKRIILITSVFAVTLFACNSESKGTTGKKEDITKNPDYQAGLAVIGKSDCLTCHKPTERIQGPSYREVADRYADSSRASIIPKLAQKVISGGTGQWGEIPMTPHPALSQEEAEAAVKYVLLLKTPK